ncbi:MAG: L-seryl-tRNA(Sec) selenium transferase, partial [Calditrichaeota bacterium]
DLGGGILLDLQTFGLPYEPVVRESIELGTDVVTFSGDKVLGGPQSGIIVGRREYIQKIKKNPLMRALRCDKLTYALLEATLRTFLHRSSLVQRHPVLRMLSEPVERLRERGEALMQKLSATKLQASVELTESEAQAGSGTLPLEKLPSVALAIRPQKGGVNSLARRLRTGSPPVIGYVQNDLFFIDLRTILPQEFDILLQRLVETLR